jgi:hypothetical protein
VPPALDALVLAALANDREARLPSAQAFLDGLDKSGVTPWSSAQRAELVCRSFVERRTELGRLLNTQDEANSFETQAPTEPFDVAAEVRNSAQTARLPQAKLVTREAPTVPVPETVPEPPPEPSTVTEPSPAGSGNKKFRWPWQK